MTLFRFSRIGADPSICGGRPTVAVTRIWVTDILASSAKEAEIVADFPCLTAADVRACLTYTASVADRPVVTAAA